MRAEGDELLAHLRAECTELRAIHAARGTYYSEDTMTTFANAAPCADLPSPPSRTMLVAEGVTLIEAVEHEVSESGRIVLDRVRGILTELGAST